MPDPFMSDEDQDFIKVAADNALSEVYMYEGLLDLLSSIYPNVERFQSQINNAFRVNIIDIIKEQEHTDAS